MSKEIIAERLRTARDNADITQKEAADALGVTLQAISSYERAVTRIDVESLGVLCDLYGVTVDSIVNGPTGENEKPAAESNGLDNVDQELMELLQQLTPEQWVRVNDFVKGLLAAR